MSKKNEEDLMPWQKINQEYLEKLEEEKKQQEQAESNQEGVDEDGDPKLMKRHHRGENEEIVQYQRKARNEENSGDENTNSPSLPEGEPQEFEEPQVEYKSFATELPKLKKQRNKVMMRRLITIISVASVFILFLLYQISPLSKLGKIEVSGEQGVKSSAIIKDSKLSLGKSLWGQYFSKNKYETAIQKSNPRIKSSKITVHPLNVFKIAVQEYKVVAYESNEKQYFPILQTGVMLQDEAVKKAPKNILILDKFNGDTDQMMALVKQYGSLKESLRALIKKVTATPKESNQDLVTLDMTDGNKVIISIEDMKEKLPYYPQVAKGMKAKGFVDMEVGIYSYSYATWEAEKAAEAEKKKEEEEAKKAKEEQEKTENSSTDTENTDESSESDANN